MKNRRKPALAVRLDVGEDDVARWAVYERASGQVLAYYQTQPKRGCVGRNQLSRALKVMRIEEEA